MRIDGIRRQAGFSLLEVTVVGGILLVSMGVAYAALSAGLEASGAQAALSDVQEQSRASIRRIVEETSRTGIDSGAGLTGYNNRFAATDDKSALTLGNFVVTAPGRVNAILYRKNQGFDNATGKIIYGPAFYLGFQFDSAALQEGQFEINNGKDDDGDGLVDEGGITLRDVNFRIVGLLATDVNKNFEIREYLEGIQVDGNSVKGNELRFFMQNMKSATIGHQRRVIMFPPDDGNALTDDRMVQSVALLSR